ncbi:MAG: hypothetical protein R2849_03415 [Thermomicrobiales bacterium]
MPEITGAVARAFEDNGSRMLATLIRAVRRSDWLKMLSRMPLLKRSSDGRIRASPTTSGMDRHDS